MGEIQAIKKSLFVWILPDYCLDFGVFMFGFSRFFRKFGKSKQKIWAKFNQKICFL
jgi:hypothetical protein